MPLSALLAAAALGLLLLSTLEAEEELKWYDLQELGVEGKGWTDTESYYDRLPATAKGVVRDPVWSLSRNSAGMCLRFRTDARSIHGRWSLLSANLDMNHMPSTGVSGLDLYARDEAATDPRLAWRWVGLGRPEKQEGNEARLVTGLPDGTREYLLYLPLYNGVTKVEVGVPVGAGLEAVQLDEAAARPIVIYGTSITQGGCASRCGMAYPAIIGRRLNRPTINLGFSGNGQAEPEMAALLAELDPAVYVLDCLPNLSAEMTAERIEPMVQTIRAAHPDTPIVLVENISYQAGWLLPGTKNAYMSKNEALEAGYDRLIAAGVANLYYVPGGDLLGDDSEATVDGTHATDLGFWRMAGVLTPVLREILK